MSKVSSWKSLNKIKYVDTGFDRLPTYKCFWRLAYLAQWFLHVALKVPLEMATYYYDNTDFNF